jgi:Protein of unknown function (DUF4239)
MARSILNTFSTIELVVLGVGGAVLLTVVGVLVARRLFPRLADSEFEPVADSLRVVYELIFALILAFVIAAVLDEIGNAEAAVAGEATTIGELVRANDTLPVTERLRLDNSVMRYVRAVANDEWETMKDGEASPLAAAALEGMYAEYRQGVKPETDAEKEAYSQALSHLEEVSSERRERLDIAAADLPTMLRVLVVVGLVLLIVLEYRPQLSPVAGLVFMGTLAMVVTSAFLLTVILNYPFAGEVSVSNEPLKQDNLARFWSEDLAYLPEPGDEEQPLTAQRLEGVYNSTAYGTLVMRCHHEGPDHKVKECGPSDRLLRGVYRYYDGAVTGEIVDGEFRGWWTQRPTRCKENDAGRLKLRLLNTSDGPLIAGSWSYLYGKYEPGWDLEEIGGGRPPDLVERLNDPETFVEKPPRGRKC